jgi:hypothetical protein
MALAEVRWGIIGCGAVTEIKSGPPLQLVEHSSLVAVMRRTPGLAEDYARRHHVQLFLMEKIVASLRGTGESPSTGETASRTNRVMDEMVKDYYQRQ